jgi:hypothetical protein
MANPSVVIDIAAEYTGKKAFAQAGKSTTNLEKSVKSLGRTLGLTLSATAVLAYGKASVKAASDDIKAQKQLALALKNVGLERDAATAEGYIQKLESEFGVVDDKLRPAYASLAIATRNTAETQRILGIALDISASTGRDLESVVAALSKAYLGNNTSLGKLGVGIAKADLKTKSFKEITDQLAVTFAGSAQASADSFAGSIDKLSIASNNAKEIIGTSLIGALQSLGNDKSIDNLSTSIEGAAKSLANFIDSIVYLKGQLASIPGAGIFTYLASGLGDLLGRFSPQRLAELVKAIKGFQGMGNVPMTGGSNMDLQKYEASQKKLLAIQNKNTKAAATAKTKADALAASNAAKLAKAQSIFDIDKIQIEAALKGKISADEKLRLELQKAILNEDFALAEKLQKQLEASQRATAALQTQINAVKPATNPFATWIDSLALIAAQLSAILGMPINTSSSILNPSGKQPGGPGAGTQTPNSPFQPTPPTPPTPQEPIPVIVEPTPTAPATNNQFAGLGGMSDLYGFSLPPYLQNTIPQAPVTVNVTVEGTVIAQQDLVKVVNDAVVIANTQGLSVTRPGGVRSDEG